MDKLFLTINQIISFFVRGWQRTNILRYFLNLSQCRFYPSCSEYFLEAIKKHGLLCGAFLTTKRILRCNPLCEGGIDEV